MPERAEDPQEAALTLELYQRQLDAVSRQIEFLQGAIDDIVRAKRSLEGIAEAENPDVLMPLGASTFVRGRVADAEKVLVGIGAGYVTERTREEALERLGQRERQVEAELERMMQTAVQIQQEAARVADDAEAGG